MNLSELYQLKLSRLTSPLTYFKGIINIASQPSKKLSKRGSAMNASSLSKKEITAMLRAWGAGEHEATEELIRAVYRDELCKVPIFRKIAKTGGTYLVRRMFILRKHRNGPLTQAILTRMDNDDIRCRSSIRDSADNVLSAP